MSTVLRPMRVDDLAALLPLEQELFAGDPPWSEQQFREELAGVPETRWYVVAEVDGALAGYAGLWAPGIAGEPADIQTIAVHPAHRRRGVGTSLMQALITESMARDAGSLLLEVRVDNTGALDFYARFGFERMALRRAYYGGGTDGLVLRKRLPVRPAAREGERS